jgi:hypothetical protein
MPGEYVKTKEGRGERLVSRKAREPQSYSMERRMQVGATTATPEVASERREAEPRPAGEPKPNRERTISTGKPADETRNRRGGKRRRASKDTEATGTIRYFLTKPTSNGTPELGEEMADEHQALLAAHKADQSFVTIEEWTAKADRRKGVTVLGKDPVVRH